MKAVAAERPRAGILGVKKDNCSIMKSTSIEFRGEKITLSDEMKECLLKLSDMVPDVPRNESGNIDGTVLMQYVIDYIQDLQLQLDGPGRMGMYPTVAFSSHFKYSDSRIPLSESSFDNIVCSQLITPSPCSDVLSSRTSDCDVRPPSK